MTACGVVISQYAAKSRLQRCCVPRRGKLPWQKGGSDCGAFAVAFATSLCTGDSPVTITYHQPSLRRHLMECLERQTITPFSGVKKKARYSEHFRVYCCCHQPESDERMVECKGYHEWYHDMCVPFLKSYSPTEQLSGFVLVVS